LQCAKEPCEYLAISFVFASALERNTVAQKVQVILEDDLEGGKADETVTFGLDGASYEIDLSTKNAAKLRDTLSPYVGSARKVSGRGGGRGRGRGGGRTPSGADTAAIRSWAKAQGLQVSDRGRIPADVVEKYRAAH
jgi:nucleoid-associated protein Lsr2